MNELLDVVSDPTLVEQAATLSNPDLAHTDFGLYSLFLRADWVVKIVMIGLVMASIQSWAIIIEKTMTLRRLSRKATDFEKLFWSGENLSSLYKSINERADHPMARVFLAGMREWVRTSSDGKEKKIITCFFKQMNPYMEMLNWKIYNGTNGVDKYYVNEKKRGIVHARNSCLTEVKKINCDYKRAKYIK